MPVLFDGRRPGLIPGTDPAAPPDLAPSPDDEAQAGITAQAVLPSQQQPNAAPDPYDTDPLIAFARSLPNNEDPLLSAFDAPEPQGPPRLITDTGVKQPGVFQKIRNTFTDEGAGYDLGNIGAGIKDSSFAAVQGLAGSFNSLTRNTMEGIGRGAVPAFADKIANALSDHPSDPVRTWWWNNMVDPLVASQTEFDLGQKASTGEKVAHALGGTLAMISQAVITGGEAEAPEALASTADVVRGAVQHGVQSMSVPALSDAVDVGRNVLQQTGDQTKAIEAAQVSYLTSVAGGIIPIAKPGGLLTRAATGAASGAVTGELARTSQNALLPESMQTPFSTEDALISAGMGGVMGAVMGPRLPDLQRVGAAIDKASADAEHAQNATFQAAMAAPPGHLESMPRYQDLYDSATASTPEEKADYARQTLANELGQAEALKATAAALQPSLELPPVAQPEAKVSDRAVPPDQGAGNLPDAAAQAGRVGFGAMAQEARGSGVDPKMIAAVTQGVLRKEVPPQEGIRMLQQAIAGLPSKEVRPTTEPPAASGGSAPESAIPVPAEAAQESPVGTTELAPAETPAVGAGELGRPAVDAAGHGPTEPAAAEEVPPAQPAAAPVAARAPPPPPKPDNTKDSALDFIAKSGGINIDQAQSEGFDPADMKSHRIGIRRAFNKKGMTLESAGEALSQAGWQVTDANGAVDKTRVLDLLNRELGGQKQYSTARSEEQLQAARQVHEEMHQAAAAEATPDTQEHADHEEHSIDFAALRLQAEQHATPDEVESAMEAQDDVEAERRLKALIARGESHVEVQPPADASRAVGEGAPALEGAGEAGARQARPRDLFGEDLSQQQALADETRRRDEARSPNKDVSIETGRPDDLFSQSRNQVDLTDLRRSFSDEEVRNAVRAAPREPLEKVLRDLARRHGIETDEPKAPEPTREPAPAPASQEPVSKHETVVDAYRTKLQNDGFKSIVEARQIYKRVTGENVEGAHVKRVDELLERAVVHEARDIVTKTPDKMAAYDKLVSLYKKQPKLGTRTSSSVENQAYSTPAPLAMVASKLAGIDHNTTVYEPTAGNGMLLIGADPAKVRANELDPDRAEGLRAQGHNPTVGDALTAKGPKSDVVIANPPFGTVRTDTGSKRFDITLPDGTKFQTTDIDQAIAFRSLEAMKQDGSAVLILGSVNPKVEGEAARSDAYNGKSKRNFYYQLYKQFHVTDHFTVDGKLYERQGAGWPVDVITIHGRGKSDRALPAADVPRVYSSWQDLRKVLEETSERPDVQNGGLGPDERGTGSNDAVGDSVPGEPVTEPGRVRAAPRGANPADGGRLPEPASGNQQPGGGPESGGPAAGRGSRVEGEGGGVPGGNQPGDAGAPASLAPGAEGSTDDNGAEASARSDTGGSVRPAEPPASVGRVVDPTALAEGPQAPYQPKSKAKAIGTLVPSGMRTAVEDSLGDLEKRVGPLNEYVAKELGYKAEDIGKYFSGEQVDALSLALDQMDRGAGFIIGDQTGVGKGRVVAGVIRFALKKGLHPIFVTEKPNLYADMYRDLRDIGQTDVRPLMTNADLEVPMDDAGKVLLKTPGAAKHNADLTRMAGESQLPDHNMVFTTYSQMQTQKGELTARQRFLQAIAPNAIVIFDESHNAGGTDVGTRGKKTDESKGGRAGFARTLAGQAKSVFYSSATYAKRPSVMDLYFKTDMAKAVEGNIQKLPAAIIQGGVPLQQVVASMLTRAGQYVRRERSFEGVEYNTPPVPVDRKAAEGISSVMLGVKAFDDLKQGAVERMKNEMKANAETLAGDGGAVGSGGVESTNFTSIMHNLIDQMLLGLKADAAADKAIEALKRGEKPVITVSNTMGSFIEDYVDTAGLKPGDALSLTFRDLLKRYLERSRTVTIKKPGDKAGMGTKHVLTDEQLGPAAVSHYKSIMRQIDRATSIQDVPVSPIDWIHSRLAKAGYTSSEITGRSHAVDYSGETPRFRMRSSKETSIAGRRNVITGFNNGGVDAVVLNQAGSTGLSLHASEKFQDQRRRRMIIAQAEKNIDTHMQMLGRVHRTGQVIAPAYDQLVADVPAEKRPAAVLAKKMASLNANTTASRSSQFTAKESVDFLNQYGDEVAAQMMEDNPDIHNKLGEPLAFATDTGYERQDAARKVTGRIPMLPVADQEALYEQLEGGYKDAITRADAMGENALEAKTLPLDAKRLDRTELFAGKAGDDSPFAQGAYADTLDVKRLGKPYTSEQVRDQVAENIGATKSDNLARLAEAGARSQAESVRAVREEYQAYRTAEETKMLSDEGMPEKAREGRLAALDGQLSRWRSIMDNVHPGGQYELTLPDGTTMYGVATEIARKKGVKMPVANGAWSVKFALADGVRQITLPLSKLEFGTAAKDSGRVSLERRTVHPLTGEKIMDMFDAGQTGSREKRTVISGNLLAGYSKVGRGQIVSYTTKDGRLEQGIMMPRSFNMKEFAESQPVEVPPKNTPDFFSRADNGILATPDGNVQVKRMGDGFAISTPISKAQGGKYFLDPGLRGLVGDFTSRGNTMRAQVNADQLRRAAQYLKEKMGAPLRTDTFRKEAIASGGAAMAKTVAEPGVKLSRGASTGSASADEVRGWVGDAARAVEGVANTHVVDNVAQLRERTGQADIPEDTKGVYISGGKDIYLVADQLGDRDAAERTFVHEVFGHLAMEKYADMDKAVAAVSQLHDMGSRTVSKLWDEVTRDQPGLDNTTQAKEVIALMAERGTKNAIMDRMVAAARGLLRKMGAKLDYSEGEVRQLIASAGRALREDARRLSPADDVHAHAADIAYRDGNDAALGEALGKMSIAHSMLDALPDTKDSAHEQDALDQASAEQLVGSEPTERPQALFSRQAKEDPGIKAIRKRIMANAKNEDLPLRDRIRNVLTRWTNLSGLSIRQGFIDGFASIAAYEKLLNGGRLLDASASAYKQTVATQNLPSVMTAIVKSGVPIYQDGAYIAANDGRKGLLHIFAPIVNHKDGNLLPQWELYAAARRASRLIEEKNPDGSSREKLFTQEDIDRSMKLGEKYPEFDRTFNDWQDFNKQVLDLAQEAGLINPESRAVWERNDYVPFYRANEDVSGTVNPMSLQRAIANQRSRIVTLKGGAQPLEDVFESMLMNTAHLVDASFKNRAAQTMVQMFDGVATSPVNMDAQPVQIDIPQVRRALDAAGITLSDALTPEQKGQWLTFFQRVKPAGDNIVSVMFGGKPKYYEVHDPLLLQSITQMAPNESMKWLDLMGFTAAKRLLTRTATALPAFMVRNFIRDTQSAWVQNPVGLKPFISAAKGFSDYLVDKPIVRDLMLAGAGGDAIYDNQPGNIKKILTREMKAEAADTFLKTVASPRRLWEMYTKLQQASENANRIAVYKGARAQGLSHAEAAYRAHDVLNFQQRGAYPGVQFLTRVVPFLNARVQGLDRLWRAFKEDRNGFLLKGAMMAAFTGVTMMLGDKDPRYQELEEWDRDAYWHIFVGDQHWRIPKGFEVGALFGTLPERAIRLMRGQDTGAATAQSLMNLIGNTFAFNPIPQLARPAVEDVTNYDFFTGRPIINDQQKEQIAPLQAQPYTSPTLQALAGMEPQWMPDSLRSPLRLEHWIRGYTSSVGMLGLTVADRLTRASGGYPDAPAKPWYEQYVPATPVTTSEPHNTKWTNQLYTMAAEADASAKALRNYASQGRYDELRSQAKQDGEKLALRPALDKMVREFGALNRQSKMILQSRMDPDKKQAMLDKINTERADLARQLAPYAGAF